MVRLSWLLFAAVVLGVTISTVTSSTVHDRQAPIFPVVAADPRFDPRQPSPCYPGPCLFNPYDPFGFIPRYGGGRKDTDGASESSSSSTSSSMRSESSDGSESSGKSESSKSEESSKSSSSSSMSKKSETSESSGESGSESSSNLLGGSNGSSESSSGCHKKRRKCHKNCKAACKRKCKKQYRECRWLASEESSAAGKPGASGSSGSSQSASSGKMPGSGSSSGSSSNFGPKKRKCKGPNCPQAQLARKNLPGPISLPPPPGSGDSDPADNFAKKCPCAGSGSSESSERSESSSESSSSSSSSSSSKSESGSESSKGCKCPEEFDIVERDLKDLRKISKKIAKAIDKVDAQQLWLDQAEKTYGTLERQIKKVNETRDDLSVELDILRRKKLEVRRDMAAEQIARDLREAHKTFMKTAVKGAELTKRKEELSEAEDKLTKRVNLLVQKLKESTMWVTKIKKLPPPA